jgi:N-carbamoylputrescine amidase
LQKLAEELKIVLPISFFERERAALLQQRRRDVDDRRRDSGRLPQDAHPGRSRLSARNIISAPVTLGFKVWDTKFGRIGVGICWDQWYPEVARAMSLMGAEILFYPTAIGFEPSTTRPLTRRYHGSRAMQGHAVSNFIPVVAANRIGFEKNRGPTIRQRRPGLLRQILHRRAIAATSCQEAGRDKDAVLIHTFDLDAIAAERPMWGFFRDRRADLYKGLVTPP